MDVLEEVGLHTLEEYIYRRRNTVAEFIATRPLFANCWEGKRLRGSPRNQFWWDQEFNLDLDVDIYSYRSNGNLAETGWLWGSNRGG